MKTVSFIPHRFHIMYQQWLCYVYYSTTYCKTVSYYDYITVYCPKISHCCTPYCKTVSYYDYIAVYCSKISHCCTTYCKTVSHWLYYRFHITEPPIVKRVHAMCKLWQFIIEIEWCIRLIIFTYFPTALFNF